tara:strand:- start:50 stop:445 length:396 start_codon:yes stop_codon:yes gene_type:complete
MINNKNSNPYKTIGQVARELNLIDKKTGNLQTHTIRYWETQFKQIKPSVRAGNRRYYSEKDFEILNYIKFLLKEKGLTINGVKKILDNTKSRSIDDDANLGVYRTSLKNSEIIKDKVKNISKIIKELKKYK